MTRTRGTLFVANETVQLDSASSLHLRPVDSLEDAELYLGGQRETYGSFRVEAAVQASWLEAMGRSVFVLIASTDAGEVVGGVRVHLRLPGTRLPVETQLGHAPLNAFIEARADEIPAEVAGIWVSRHVAGEGVADFLCMGAMAAARSLGAEWACGYTHRKGMSIWSRYGICSDTSIRYAYPDERYVTYPVFIDLDWPAQPTHPARSAYRSMMHCYAARRPYEFTPSVARTWAPPVRTVVPWAMIPAQPAELLRAVP